MGLVGDDAPGDPVVVKLTEKLCDAGEKTGLFAHVLRVVFEQLPSPGTAQGLLLSKRECLLDEPDTAACDPPTRLIERNGCQASADKSLV